MTTEIYIAALFIILLAYFIRGITGFGSGLIAIPLLAHLLPLTFVVPLILVLDFLASVVLTRHTKLQVQWHEIGVLLPPTIIGMLAGTFLLINLPREPLLLGLGSFVILFGLRYLFNVHSENPISRWWSAPTGLAGGTIGAMFGTGGPPYVVYLSHRLQDKTQLVGTLSGIFMLEGALRVAIFLYIGLLSQDDMIGSLLLALPLMSLGLYLGTRVHLGISHRQQLGLIGGMLLLSGGSLIWKAWA
ncbi:MAG: sulfite exporter TauE/SafE family protein [Gammaproteobacteria bacterium]|nr:sulfite exporter TauE/SafE family protein [Gammaproteobacteria bacterium]